MFPDSAIPHLDLNKGLVRQSFNHAAHSYNGVAVLQRQVGDALLERLDVVRRPFQDILDIGAGTGYCLQRLGIRYKKANLYALDMADAMLQRVYQNQSWWQRHFGRRIQLICADMERLPLADECVDMVFSNLTLQWCTDPGHTFRELIRVLKPGGLLTFTTLGPDTLKELKSSWHQADANSTHVHDFIDMHHIGDMLVESRFAEPVIDVDYYTLTYNDVFTLMRELKALGAHNAATKKTRGLTGKGRLRAMQNAYEQYRESGRLPASYEVVFGHAWKAESKPGQVRVSFS